MSDPGSPPWTVLQGAMGIPPPAPPPFALPPSPDFDLTPPAFKLAGGRMLALIAVTGQGTGGASAAAAAPTATVQPQILPPAFSSSDLQSLGADALNNPLQPQPMQMPAAAFLQIAPSGAAAGSTAPPGATAIPGSMAPFQGFPAPPPSQNALLVQQAALRALGLVNPGQNETGNVQPYTDNFAKVVDPSAINMKNWTPEISVHADNSAESSVPGYPSYVVKAYHDPNLGNTVAVTYPTWTPEHILGLIPYKLGYPVNAGIAKDFLDASATNGKSGK